MNYWKARFHSCSSPKSAVSIALALWVAGPRNCIQAN